MQVRAAATGTTHIISSASQGRVLSDRLVRGLLLAGVAYGAMSMPAIAQTDTMLDFCAGVEGEADMALCEAAETSTLLDQLTVISRTGDAPIDTLASVSRVDAEALDRRMPSTLNDVFFGTPGVSLQTDARRAGSAANVRGLQEFGRVQVIVDGARQNFNRSGHGTAAMVFVDPNLIESAEVIRGPVANTYGSGAIGGVVMFNTKSADTFLSPSEQYALETSVNYDSNTRGITSSATGAVRLTEDAGVLASLSWRRHNEYTGGDGETVDGSDFEVLGGLVKATVRPTEYSELDLSWNRTRNDWTESSGEADIDSVQNTFSGQFEVTDPGNDLLDLHVNASINAVDLTSTTLVDRDQFSSDNGQPITIPAGSETTYDLTTYALDVWNTSRFWTGPVSHELTYGADWVMDDMVTTSPASSGSDVYTPSGQRALWGAHVENKMIYDWLEVIGGVRFDSYSLESESESASGTRLSPRLTIGVSPFAEGPLSGFQVYGTYAEGYRSPSTTETLMSGLHPEGAVFPFLPNPGLVPEIGKTWELGFNYAYDGLFDTEDSLRIKAAYFNNTITDYIGGTSFPTGENGCDATPSGPIFAPGVFPPQVIGYYPGTCYQYQNFASAEIHGVELEALYDAGDWFAGLNASFIDGHTIEDGERAPLLTVPTGQVTGTAGVRLLDRKMTLGGEVQQNWAPEGSDMDDYTVVNLFASYEASENVDLNLRVDNLFDTTYANPLSGDPELYEPGLSIKVGATVRW
ncbi:TonB-dependent receptor domain-containing protein [Pelagibacterium montanilacus]|uniref:TonB-dependent receptor domain-containing protein n=1 Tax=Pelagibacterium montanilacus TaxID=2185280 RepID=UPI000F8EE763|nr:TonB-dependent receptor [Pelagibacterium montanilacus]